MPAETVRPKSRHATWEQRKKYMEMLRKKRALLKSQKRNQNRSGYKKRTTRRTNSFKSNTESTFGGGITLDRMDRPVNNASRLNRHHHKFFSRKRQPVSHQWGNTAESHPKYIGSQGVENFERTDDRRYSLSKQYNSNPALQGTGVLNSQRNNWWSSDAFLGRF